MDSSETPGVATPGGSPPPLPDINKLISQYLMLRAKKKATEARHKAELKPYTDLMAEVEGLMLDYMNQTGSDSIKTDGGTAYKSTTPRATIKDATAFRNFVIAMGSFDLVDWKANANAVADHVEANTGTVPPGLNFSTFTAVRFRKPGED